VPGQINRDRKQIGGCQRLGRRGKGSDATGYGILL